MRKSELPVGAVIEIGGCRAVKIQDSDDTGDDWAWLEVDRVNYDDAHKASWDFPPGDPRRGVDA